ncbi:DUF192 domain-containing protein [Undibacterium sp. Jales W-56]|uniref:DUF192 domain-containing protein n=1 Tax=Undibacterium sp. Jales W-56 TaxID=2897325 RepID=UPI0021D2307F|nr:DUF192 domain-containing protein [Undibacterium sp. Jales W-56]MCU6432954.1 DUF192 domain-containing protein [Undibacterium sp. Jales W-56]
MTNSSVRKLTALALLSLTCACATAQTRLPVKQLSIGINVIQAEVAATDADRQQGLMNRTRMGASEGMVFDFGAPAGVCMWMKNTLIPLSVAFIDGEGKIVNVEDMQPETTDSHCAKKTVRYALEMNLGWFKQKNVKPGTKIEGLPLQ